MQATITSKGQVTLPKPVRDKLRLRPGDKIDFMAEEGGSLRVAPVARGGGGVPGVEDSDGSRVAPATASVTRLRGMAPKPGLPVSLEAMDEAAARAVAGHPG